PMKRMPEIYTLKMEGAALVFEPRTDALAADVLNADAASRLANLPEGWSLAACMGDPELLYCVAWRSPAGGCFCLYEADNVPLLAAVAESALAYAQGLAHFGRLVAEPRYAVDMYENLDGDDD
ncbi:MAG: hypothetical protein Q4F27_04365, partial [Desulfovibrionaceae bacterium]|nr:hypothetical protein [Desulfovibrionaceae bacterium]